MIRSTVERRIEQANALEYPLRRSAIVVCKFLILPGLGDSGPGHWQSMWETEMPGCQRVIQRDWVSPALEDWRSTLDRAVENAELPVVLVAHSLACALVAHFAKGPLASRIEASLMVAPADVSSNGHRLSMARGFGPMPMSPFPFKTIVVASSDDPYVRLERAREFAQAWRGEFVDVGPNGHLNAASGHGPWPEGRRLLDELVNGRGEDREVSAATEIEGSSGASRRPDRAAISG